MKFINENVYLHGRANISNFLISLLHKFLDLTPAINKGGEGRQVHQSP
jgi:hypothetical protein